VVKVNPILLTVYPGYVDRVALVRVRRMVTGMMSIQKMEKCPR